MRSGVAMPDWSMVTAEGARRALEAIGELEGLLDRFSNIEPIEDDVWRLVLEGYGEVGRALTVAEIVGRTGLDAEGIRGVLRRLRERDLIVLDAPGNSITGAYPFTDIATPHGVLLRGHVINAMCAIDALGAGAMYGEDVEIGSACHQCGRAIAITTRDRGHALQKVDPEETVVWAGLRYANGCAATSLCTVLAFFCSDAHLEAWRRVNAPGPSDGMRLTLTEAMEIGKAGFVPRLAPPNTGVGSEG
jgi:hypothetical protein